MNIIIKLILIVVCMAITGCATIFKGYYDTVDIYNAPSDLKIRTIDGVEVPIQTFKKKEILLNEYGEYAGSDTTIVSKRIKLRSSRDNILVLSFKGKEFRYEANKKLGIGWFLLDLFTGGFGAGIDYLTGNWHYFDDIEFQ